MAAGAGRGGTWNAGGVILLAHRPAEGIRRITPSGGDPVAVTQVDVARGERSHGWPVFLPDGRRFLFHVTTLDPATTGVYVGALDSSERSFVVASPANAAYAPPGYLLYVRGTALFAQRFDIGTSRVTGEPQPLVQEVAYNPTTRRAEFSVSTNGVLAYASGGLNVVGLGWFDRAGNKVGAIDALSHMDIAPDDVRVAADRFDTGIGTRDVWVFDALRGSRTRLTFSPENDWVPLWSPDGTSVAFTADRDKSGLAQIYIRNADGSGADRLLLRTDANKHHMDWSVDGRLLVFESGNPQDIWAVTMPGARDARPVLQGPFVEAQPAISPDSRFIGYASNESGVLEVYVQALGRAGGRWQISTAGGIQPLWRLDGKEMYYLAADGKVMALDVDLARPSFGVPKALFRARWWATRSPSTWRSRPTASAS